MAEEQGARRLALNLMGMEELGGGSLDAFLQGAVLADELAVDLLVLPDHLALSERAHREREGFPYPITSNWLEPMTALGAVAAVTKQARLGTGVMVAPLRPAILLAKQLATLDVLSGGRVEVALGAGWQVEEFEAAGMAFEGRFGQLEEIIDVCRALWSAAPAAHHGRRIDFDDLVSLPFPTRSGEGLRISLGMGLSPRNIERIVRLGVGWTPAPMPAEDLAAGVQLLRTAWTEGGRDLGALVVSATVSLVPHGVNADVAGAPHPLDEAVGLWEAGAEVVMVHPVAFCRQVSDLPEFLAPLLEARFA